MGAAAGLIRLRCDQETNLSQPIPSPGHNPPGLLLTFLDLSEICWKTRVDLCSLLLLLVPVLAQVLPSLPFLPSLGLAANVLFVLPQLVVITGDLFPTKNIGLSKRWLIIREHLTGKKSISFGHCPNYLPPPLPHIRATCTIFFGRHKRRLARIREPSNNDVSDNCDHNFGTFDDFGVNNDQKVSNNMILMSKYKGKHGGKKGQKIWAGVSPPPLFGQGPKENIFFQEGFP